MFYKAIDYLCDIEIPKDTGDFRLVSKRVVGKFKQLPEKHRFIRGMFPWIGFTSKAILYDRDERYAGETKYPLKKMILFASDAILSFSSKPLMFTIHLGLFICFLGILFAIYMLYIKFFTVKAVSGITAVILTILIIGGTQITLLGVLGQYVGRIFEEVKRKHCSLYRYIGICECVKTLF